MSTLRSRSITDYRDADADDAARPPLGPEFAFARTDGRWPLFGRAVCVVTVRCRCGSCDLTGLLDARPSKKDREAIVAFMRRKLRERHVCEQRP